MVKSATALRTIGEVADELGVQPHVLRFWESKFPQIKPQKRRGGHRYYRPEDVQVIRDIQSLLRDQGFTIKGAQKHLKDQKSAPAAADQGTLFAAAEANVDVAAIQNAIGELKEIRALLS